MNSPGFEEIVSFHYESLYRFAFSLTHTEADAGDLTRLAFSIYAEKSQQFRDYTKAKSWLFTTLHRSFLQRRRKQNGFPRFELSESEAKLPHSPANHSGESDRARIVRSLSQVDELYRTTIALFCLEDYTYREIAEILEIPPGTVKSRLSKGLSQLSRNYFDDPSLSLNS
jgi:RNA polymerase sigma factor (sigma-70 family)